jgi:hypothetical protein
LGHTEADELLGAVDEHLFSQRAERLMCFLDDLLAAEP